MTTAHVTPDPRLETRTRRRFTGAEKLALLDAFDALAHGDKGEWLRQNGLYAAQLSIWRKERREHGEAGLEPKTPGQKPKDPRDVQIEQLSREVSKLRKRAELAEALVDLQKKVWCLDEWTPNAGSAS
jgi:transposase-like protein